MNKIKPSFKITIFVSYIAIGISLLFSSCKETQQKADFIINTPYGEMGVLLYDDVVSHKARFAKAIETGIYEHASPSLIKKDKFIQITSNATEEELSQSWLMLPPEIKRNHINKKGAISVYRKEVVLDSDLISYLYGFNIVSGKILSDAEIDETQNILDDRLFLLWVKDYLESPAGEWFNVLTKSIQVDGEHGTVNYSHISQHTKDSARAVLEEAYSKENESFTYELNERNIYRTIGGAPDLDMQYSIIGEVVWGLNIIDSLNSIETDSDLKPYQTVPVSLH